MPRACRTRDEINLIRGSLSKYIPTSGLIYSMPRGVISHLQKLFLLGYAIIVGLFLVCGFALIFMAGLELWHGISRFNDPALKDRFDSILETVALLTIAVAALELGQTVLEEEILRKTHISAPTRVRRFLSRFLIVVVVSLSIECLVSVFQLAHKNPALLPQAAFIGIAAAALLTAWGLFLWLNMNVEHLEPEAMEATKKEDHKMR